MYKNKNEEDSLEPMCGFSVSGRGTSPWFSPVVSGDAGTAFPSEHIKSQRAAPPGLNKHNRAGGPQDYLDFVQVNLYYFVRLAEGFIEGSVLLLKDT